MRVLILDSEAEFGRNASLFLALRHHKIEHTPDIVDSFYEAEAHLAAYHYDVVLMHQCHETREQIIKLRRSRKKLAIIVLASTYVLTDLVRFLLSGADDYQTAPLTMPELIARMQAIVRRHAGYTSDIVQCGRVVLDLHNQLWVPPGVPWGVHLTKTEWRIVLCLVLANGAARTKQELHEYLYSGRSEKDLKMVDVMIHHIRKKFDRVGFPKGTLATVWGRGYFIDVDGADESLQEAA